MPASPNDAPFQILGVPQSNFVRAVRMAFEEKSVPYEHSPLLPHSPEVLAIHPLGKIPVLRHGDVALAESRAIVSYLERLHPEPALIPEDPVQAARAEQWISMVGTSIDRTMVRDYFFAYFRPKGPDGQPDRGAIEAALPLLRQQIGALNQAVEPTGHLVGERFTYADINLMPILNILRTLPESAEALEAAPALKAYLETHATRPSFVNTASPPL